MTNRIHDAFAQVHATDELKAATLRALRQKAPRPATVYWKPLSAVLAMLVVLLGMGVWSVRTPVAYISIDVNPSMELSLNRFDRIVAATAYNSDGQTVLAALDLQGKTYTEGIDLLLSSPTMQAYLTDTALLTFTVAARSDQKEDALLSGITACPGYGQYGAQCRHGDTAAIAQAHQSGLSFGKYAAYLTLAQYDTGLTVEDCQQMSMAQIHELIRFYQEEAAPTGGGQQNGYGRKRKEP